MGVLRIARGRACGEKSLRVDAGRGSTGGTRGTFKVSPRGNIWARMERCAVNLPLSTPFETRVNRIQILIVTHSATRFKSMADHELATYHATGDGADLLHHT